MEISPIPGIRVLPVSPQRPADLGLAAVVDIENHAHVDNESYSPNDGKSTGGEDEFVNSIDKGTEEETTEEGTGEETEESKLLEIEDTPGRKVNYFA
jgi:hypothetical protein